MNILNKIYKVICKLETVDIAILSNLTDILTNKIESVNHHIKQNIYAAIDIMEDINIVFHEDKLRACFNLIDQIDDYEILEEAITISQRIGNLALTQNLLLIRSEICWKN